MNGNESTVSNIAATFPTNNTAGNLLVVTGTAARPHGTITISDTVGNIYVPAIGPTVDTVQDTTAYVWYVPNCKSGSNTVTLIPSTPDAMEIHISEFSGIATTSPLDQVSFATGTGPTASSGARATTVNGELIFGYTFLYNTAVAGPGYNGMSLVNGDLDEYLIQPAAGSVSATFTQASGTWFALMATFQPAGGSTGQTWSISGTIGPASAGAGVTVGLSGASSATVTADASGNYSFTGLANGTYTITPSQSGYTFAPASQSIAINGANIVAVNFTAQAIASNWSISGIIGPASAGAGATVGLSGASSATVTADASGNYSFTGLANGTYTITPSQSGYTFAPASQSIIINGANIAAVNFTAQAVASNWSISGTIGPASAGAGVTVGLNGPLTATVTADASGNYSFAGLANGAYTVTPAQSGYTFVPGSQPVTINGASVTALNFIGQVSSPPPNPLITDATTSMDGTIASKTISTAAFSTNSASELLLAFISTDYISGSNAKVNSVSGGGLSWVLVRRTNVQSGTSEIWRAFATSPLSGVTVTATLSQSVVSSLTVMSFTGVVPSGTSGSGAIGATGSGNSGKGAPTASLTTTRNGSMVLGVGNDYDNSISRAPGANQRLVHQDLAPTGDTYWVQTQSAPIPASGTTVTINDTVPNYDRYNLTICEILPASGGGGGTGTPPTVAMKAPAAGSVANLSTLWAVASDVNGVAGVQFLLDGAALGTEVTSTPYTITWDTRTASSGSHNLAARARNTAGLTTTSASVPVTVDNSGNPAVVGSWSSVVNIPAVAVNLVLLKNNKVLFYQDGASPTVWDYVNGTFTSVPTNANLFCSGHALLADGRVLVVGGFGGGDSDGIASAEIFDPSNNSWTAVPNMSYRRWYPTATTLSDGTIMVTAGWQTGPHANAGIPEIYNSATNTWTKVTSANNPFETYPFLYQLSDGRVIHVGNSEYATVTDILDLTTQTWSVVDPNIVDGASCAMYLPGKIMKAGTATDSQGSGPSANTTYVLDTTVATPAWQQTPSMAYSRSFLNLPVLPDGTVLAIGGETDKNGGNIANAVYPAERWSPQTQTWSTVAAMHTPREYHGTALLLPDARVLVSGMGADFGNVPNEMNTEFYSPAYLFQGARPSITQAPAQISYGTNFFISTPDAASITSAVLIRTGAVTHFFDQNTRYVPVTFQQSTGGLTISAPVGANFAPPGYYMLFIVNSSGIPSIAPFLQLQ